MQHTLTNSQVLSADGEMPIRLVHINGIPYWQASGRTFPVVAGAEDPPPTPKPDDPPKPKEGEGNPPEDGDDFDKDRALATIKKLRASEKLAAADRKELDDLRKKVKESDDAQKSEGERLKEQLAEATREAEQTKRELQETRNRTAIERAASKAGAADPEDVFRLLNPSDFERDDAGKLTNADELVKALLKAKPYLAGRQSGTSGVPGTPRSNGQPAGHDDRVKENREKLIASGDYDRL